MNARDVIATKLPFSEGLRNSWADEIIEHLANHGHIIMKKEDVEAIREALRGMFCPRPCNNRPDQFDVGDCFDAGECGCIAGPALRSLKSEARG